MKKRQVAFYVALMLMLLCTSVYATISGNMNITASKTDELSAGEEFTVTLSVDNMSSGVVAVDGYINIDENVLDKLTVSSIVTNSDGKVKVNSNNNLAVYDASSAEASSAETGITFNTKPESGKGDYRLVINLANAITSKTDLVTIKFKVKSGVSKGTYKDAISYTLFKIYSDSDKGDVTSKSLSITVGDKVSNENTANNTNTNNATNNATTNNATNNAANNTSNKANNVANNATNNTNTNNATTNNSTNKASNTNKVADNSNKNAAGTTTNSGSKADNTTATGSLPKTGYKFIILPIIGLAIAGIIFYKKYEQYNKF